MKNKKFYIAVVILTFIFAIFLLNTTSYAGSQKLTHIDYVAKLNSDGSADITETWNIKVTDTNTLFKTFELDRSKYTGITNVQVSEITASGQEIQFIDTGKYAYHVEKGGFYALANNTKEFEIAWGVSINGTENKKYKIKYTILDAVKTYNDCSEFYWQFIGQTNDIPSEYVTGRIKLPSQVTKKENLRAWAHGPLNGNIEIKSEEIVTFEVEDLQARTMIEVRIVALDNDIFVENLNTYKSNKLTSILSEENTWANEANAQRDRINKQKEREKNAMFIFLLIISAIVVGFLCVLIAKIKKYKEILSQTQKIEPEQKLDYFRDFPDETATPAEAAFLYYFDKNTVFSANKSKIASAIILNLALKKAIAFKVDEKEKIHIILNNDFDEETLEKDEKSIYEILVDVEEFMQAKKGIKKVLENPEEYQVKLGEHTKEGITMKDIEKYAQKNDLKFCSKIDGLEAKARTINQNKGKYDAKLIKKANEWDSKKLAYVGAIIAEVFTSVFIAPMLLIIPSIICAILCSKICKKTRTLTPIGENEKEQWQALKRYMEDFSLLNEREVPELVLWEKYLVYATAFGVADKVIKQLKIKYPQILDETYMINNGYTHIYMANRINLERSIVVGMQSAYSTGITEINARNSGNYSSGGGFGGGFSGGGRRPAEVEAGMGGR